MFLINEPLIKAVNLTSENVIIIWESYWYQDDIEELMSIFFNNLDDVSITENIKGADRSNIRFNYKTGYFVLNFESYSQSCWIEPEDELSRVFLTQIEKRIIANL
jgi:hypothetical protein